MNNQEKRMMAILQEGREKLGFAAVKAEFEAEGTRTSEFQTLLHIARRAGLKVGLKIGGAEAMRDLIESREFGVDYIIAPMVETPYALCKYIEAKNKVYSLEEQQDVDFLFNVETITTLNQIEEMAAVAGQEGGCDGMVFGRVDFVGSLQLGRMAIESEQVTNHVLTAAHCARHRGLELVVGGGVGFESERALKSIRQIALERFETRKVIFDAALLDRDLLRDALTLAAEFELLWLRNKRDNYRLMAEEDEVRIRMLEERWQSVPSINAKSAAA